jgi:hypothetical protein
MFPALTYYRRFSFKRPFLLKNWLEKVPVEKQKKYHCYDKRDDQSQDQGFFVLGPDLLEK